MSEWGWLEQRNVVAPELIAEMQARGAVMAERERKRHQMVEERWLGIWEKGTVLMGEEFSRRVLGLGYVSEDGPVHVDGYVERIENVGGRGRAQVRVLVERVPGQVGELYWVEREDCVRMLDGVPMVWVLCRQGGKSRAEQGRYVQAMIQKVLQKRDGVRFNATNDAKYWEEG